MHAAALPNSLLPMGSYTPWPPYIDHHAFYHSPLHTLITTFPLFPNRVETSGEQDSSFAWPLQIMLVWLDGMTSCGESLIGESVQCCSRRYQDRWPVILKKSRALRLRCISPYVAVRLCTFLIDTRPHNPTGSRVCQ